MTFSVEERNKLVLEMMPRVSKIAWYLKSKLPASIRHDDLVSAGVVGLIKAIDTYDPESGANLNTFATYRIRGAMLDSLRELDMAPRSCRIIARKIAKATEYARVVLGRDPEDWEIASAMNMDFEDFCSLRCVAEQAPRIEGIGPETKARRGADHHRPDHAYEATEQVERINAAVCRLTETQEKVLTMMFWLGMTGKEIAATLEISEQGVWSAKRAALNKLNGMLKPAAA